MTTRKLSPEEIEELRSATRYGADPALRASFGPVEVEIADLSLDGAQLRHSDTIRLGSTGRLVLVLPRDERFAVRTTIIWSHMSRISAQTGRPPLVSGARFDATERETIESLIKRLLALSLVSKSDGSLEAKRERAEEKERQRRQSATARQVFSSQIPNDQLMMINHARERLRSNPDEAKKWYQRARYALLEDETRMKDAPKHYREDVLAVWEYLERSVEIGTILKVFERHLR